MKELFILLRPQQWLKNGFVFAPLFFSGNLLNWELFRPAILAFISFCLISSSIYCYNDICDYEADRLHPHKCKRPIASGTISKKIGYAMMLLCAIAAFIVIAILKNPFFLLVIIASYWIMNISYCIKLKHYAIMDVMVIAVGFVMRVFVGGLATGLWVSHWLVLMTFLIALFLALSKRLNDFHIFAYTGIKPRKSITGYNETFINEATSIVLSMTMVCYIMYTMSEEVVERMGTRYVYLTSGWVLLGMFRYLQKMIVYDSSESPTKAVMEDRFVQLCVCGWIISFVIILYI